MLSGHCLALLVLAFALPARADNAALGKFLAAYAPAHKFSGAISVVVDGKPAYHGAFGIRERAFSTPARRTGGSG
jgi:hypothetical protein